MASALSRTDPSLMREEDITALRELEQLRLARGLPGIGQDVREIVDRLTLSQIAPPTCKVWRTIAIGGKSRDELLAELKVAGFRVYDWARSMMSNKAFVTESEPREIDITTLTVAELGFQKGTTTRGIWARAEDIGLELCPPSVGPHLRLAYRDQPLNERIWVAMGQIVVTGGYPLVFTFERVGDGQWLFGGVAGPDDGWPPGNHRFVFVLPRK